MTPSQANCLQAIRDLTTPDGVTPSYRQLALAMDTPLSNAHRLVEQLEEDGKLFRLSGHRGIRLAAGPYERLTLESLPSETLAQIRDTALSIIASRKARAA